MIAMIQGCGEEEAAAGSKRSRQTEAPKLESWLELTGNQKGKAWVRRTSDKEGTGAIRAVRTKSANTGLQ